MTRNLMIFGQGAMKCHPYICSEIERLMNDDKEQFINNFKRLIILKVILNIWLSMAHAHFGMV